MEDLKREESIGKAKLGSGDLEQWGFQTQWLKGGEASDSEKKRMSGKVGAGRRGLSLIHI